MARKRDREEEEEGQETILDEPDDAIPPAEVPTDDIGHVKAALRVLASNLTKKADGLKDLHQVKAETAVRAEIGQLTEVIPRALDDGGIDGLSEKQRDLCRTAIPLYVKNLKAAKGTVLGVSRPDWAQLCIETAADVEQRILPLLDEQTAHV